MTILITGGAGFIGSNFIKYIFSINPELKIINLDALTYAGNLENLKDIENNPNYRFIQGQIQDVKLIDSIIEENKINAIINFAAESHVDRSIINARPFIDTNITGTLTLLEVARKHNINRYLQVSTDEVYGSLGPTGYFTEDTPIDPQSPYSASKASADHFVMAFVNTYKIDAVITRCSNNYGPYQFPEKLIPLMVLNALNNKKLPVYGDGLNIRDWIYVEDHCAGIWKVFNNGKSGEVYNIGGKSEKTNITIVKKILKILDKPESLIEFVKDRPGHDRRYAIDCSKIEKELNWEPQTDFEEGIKKTIRWYIDNPSWCDNVISGAYMEYYNKQYNEP